MMHQPIPAPALKAPELRGCSDLTITDAMKDRLENVSFQARQVEQLVDMLSTEVFMLRSRLAQISDDAERQGDWPVLRVLCASADRWLQDIISTGDDITAVIHSPG